MPTVEVQAQLGVEHLLAAVALKTVWQRMEQMNGARLNPLTQPAQRRGTEVRTLVRQLGVAETRDVF